MKKHSTKSRFSPLTVVLLVILILYVLSMFGILFWGGLTAFKDDRLDIKFIPEGMTHGNTYGFPRVWKWNVMDIVFKQIVMPVTGRDADFWEILGNSLLYAVGCAFLKTLVPCLTAYSCARYNFKSSKVVHTIVLVAMIVPIVGSLPSELKIAYALGFYDKIWGVWLMSANMLGLYFFVMYSAFKAMPMGYSEAAKIDGASNFQIMVRIALPLIKNLFLTVFLINFVEFWNNYQTPKVYLPNYPTLGYTLFYYKNTNHATFTKLPNIISLALVVMLPVLILFLIFQERLMGNLTLGGLKG